MSCQYEVGWIDQMIFVECLEGCVVCIVKGVNELVVVYIVVKMKVVSVVIVYGQGNFELLMDCLLGKKVQIIEVIDGVCECLCGVVEVILV